ncbi:uncharacterized protein LOC103023462 [Astyanax mexicanus]|uniref:uncharacterized protein LOC103023462 n=1 Tax=Astyanax mexicanus TaxID=7994 RepID=UPI0020CB1597|nr:uncharacterized protein LOC103023462 [Astyanax mexicanus]
MADLQLIKATQNITKASSSRDDTKLIMQPYANWEEYLTPGPLSIAILGELVFISSNVDFSINKNPPKDGFKYIKYPESFRACLMQVCNAGWGAFNVAHKNMDQIRLHTGNVPEYIKMSVQILLQEDNELVQTFLPDQLQNIENIANDCVELATAAENKFMEVIELIQELLEASQSAKSKYTLELEEVKQKREIEMLKKKASEEANKSAAKAMEEMNQQLKDAQAAFKESMDSLPSGWEAIGMDLVEGLAGTVNSMLSSAAFLSAGTMFSETIKTGSAVAANFTNASQSGSATVSVQENDPVAISSIYSKSSHMLSVSQSLLTFIENEQIKWEALRDKTSGRTTSNFQKNSFEDLKQSISKQKECHPKQEALAFCEKGIMICSDLAKYSEQGGCEDNKMKKLVLDIQNLSVSVQTFDSKAKANTNTPAFITKPPQLSKTQTSDSGKKSASQVATENARLRIEQNRAHMEQVRAAYEKRVSAMEESKKELNEILISIRKCKVQEIDFSTTIKFLLKGLDALGRVKEQWEKMVRFFQMVSNIIKTCLHTSLTSFTSTVQKSSTLPYSPTMFIKDMIYTQAFHASNIASLVNMIAGTYTEVSNKHLMDRVSSLGKLMALDPNNANFQNERLQLQNGCKEAEDSILQLVKTNKRNFESKTRARQAEIERELKAVMPPASPKDTEKLQKIVQRGFNKKEEQDVENQYV